MGLGGAPKSGGIRCGPKGGGIKGGDTFRDSKWLKPPRRGWGQPPGGWHCPPGSGWGGGSSPASRCLRMGRNAASRLTLTITLGEEKAFGCNEYFLFGPRSVGGGGGCIFPSLIFFFFLMLLPEWGWQEKNGVWGLGFVHFSILGVGSPYSLLCTHCLAGCGRRCVFRTGILVRYRFTSTPGTWGLDRLRNLLPALCKGPRR